MAYSITSDIQALFAGKITFEGHSTLSSTDLTNLHIPAADAIIDGRLRDLYTVPITDSDDLKLLKNISRYLTADMVHGILYSEDRDSANPNDAVRTWNTSWGRAAMKQLDMIADRTIKLVSARASEFRGGIFENYVAQTSNDVTVATKIGEEW